MGSILGLICGPVGVLFIPLLPDARSKCKWCANSMPLGAKLCLKCNREQTP